MNNSKKIKIVCFEDGAQARSKDDYILTFYPAGWFGEGSIEWIVGRRGDKEIISYNCRYISSIEWEG